MKSSLEMAKQSAKRGIPSAKRFLFCSPLLAMLFLLIAVLTLERNSFGQGITGSVTGSVTDSSGASVAGATVTVRQTETNAARVVTTSDIGSYTVTQLAPGTYSVQVDKSGFKTFQQNDIVLEINQVAQINAQLGVGAQQETVVVTSTPPVIQTNDSSVGLVIDSQTILNTPLNGRLSVIGLIALAPGVQGAGAQDQLAVRGVTPSIGTGTRNSYGGLGSTLDGVTNQEVTLQRGEAEVPSLDAIGQFKVITTGAPAEFNQPAQMIVVSKSGGNQVHGGLFEYNRSKGTSAKAFFGGALPRPPYERNEFGGNLSGPIYIPKIYDGRDKSFFFFAYEGFRLSQSTNVNSQQPTLAERSGDFSAFSTPVINPLTGKQFSGNMIPSTSFNTVDVQLQNILFPLPTAAGTGINTFELVPFTSEASRISVRLDHKINDHNQIRATYLRAFYGPNPDVGTSSLAGGFSGDGEHNSNVILGWTHTISPTLLVDTYASYFHLPIYRTPQNSNVNFSTIIPGLGPELIQGAPQLTITNITSVSEQGSKDLEQVIQANTAVTKVLPKHTIKAGFSYLWDNHWNDAAVAPQRGSYSFTGRYSGIAYADFLLGYPNSTGLPSPNNYITRNLSSQYGMYAQDDWKIRPNLTLNIGLRYDLQWFSDNPYGNNSLYVPSQQKIVVWGNSYPPSAIPGFLTLPITLSSKIGFSNNVWDYLGQDKNNVAPRFGFAYEAIPNWVLRGAVGIYFNLLPASYLGGPFATLPFSGSETFSQPSGSIPAFNMYAPFSATGAFAANPTVSAQHHTVTPYTEQYNLALEHQFSKGLDIRIGYVGQRNIKQNNASGSGNVAPDINLNTPQVGVTVQSRRLVQPFSTIGLFIDPIFHSTMNALQIGVHKEYAHGFMINAEYQWTRILGTENLEDPSGSNTNDSFGNVAGITPQVFVVSYSYALPFGTGQALFGGVGNVVNKVIGGWQLSGITSFQTGQPFSATYTAPGSPVGLVSGRANRVPGVNLYPTNKSRVQWFNPAAFTAPPTYVSNGVTYATYGNSGYNMLWGPAWQNWDMSLQKNTVWKERYKLQLRADSFNIFNHPNFAPPNAAISNTSTVGTITSISSSPAAQARTVAFAVKFNF
jgi:Carboxypeptidase regulatory-like domain/TonB dependent receptor